MKQYRTNSWIDPRIRVQDSPLHGKGLFARKPIKEDEIVVIWGGHVFTKEDIKAGRHRERSAVQIGDNLFLGGLANETESEDDFLNHSCDPNLWLIDEVTLVARRDISIGEELTADYSSWINGSDWKLKTRCNCGFKICRGIVTGDDWKRKDLQKRYKNHFSPYLEKKIKESSHEQKNKIKK